MPVTTLNLLKYIFNFFLMFNVGEFIFFVSLVFCMDVYAFTSVI